MDIDWSKAPEGATHRVPNGCWYKIEDGLVWCWSSRGEWAGPYPKKQYEDGSMEDMLKLPRTASEWNGEGLPPVGVDVEIHNKTCRGVVEGAESFIGTTCKVVATFVNMNGYEMVAVEDTAGACMCFRADMCGPVRTPEQIAVEEREKFISEICGLLGWDASLEYSRRDAIKIFDARYRKFEIVESE